jgi:hypothetical protein
MRPPFLFFRSCSHLRIFVLDYNQTKHIKNKKMKKQFLSSIPEVFEEMQHTNGTQATKRSWLGLGKTVESYWYILVVFFGMLLLYAMARIISLQRRVRDLEARPPVDDITLRGAVRLQLNDLVSDLEQTLRAKQTDSTSHLSPPPPPHPTSIPLPLPYPAPPPSFARKQDVVDEELNQVLEIANSVKASLPDVKLFANAMKMQKQKSKENEKEKEMEKSKENEKEKEIEKSKENEKEKENEREVEKVEKVEKTETNEEVKEEKVNKEVKQDIEDKIEMEVEKEQINIQNQKQEEQDVPRWSTPVLKKEKEKEKEKKLKIANSANFKRGAGARRKGDTDTVDHQ